MKHLFFTSTSPRHPYKSEKFFYLFQKMRYINFFGRNKANNHRTIFKKMLILKRFFGWYYTFLGNRHFCRLMRNLSIYNRSSLNLFYKFLYLLEMHVRVILVRSNLVRNLFLAKTMILGNAVHLNGKKLQNKITFLKQGDLLELQFWQQVAYFQHKFPKYFKLRKFKNKFFFGASSFYTLINNQKQ